MPSSPTSPLIPSPPVVDVDSRSLILSGRRRILLSGEIEFSRIPRDEWEVVLQRTKEAGINCIATSAFWNCHEPKPGCYDFSGPLELNRFLRLCAEAGLLCLVRLGPYCGGGSPHGGLPLWLREIPGIVLRTSNRPYLEAVTKYFRLVVQEIIPHLISHGGNVVFVEVEREYGELARCYGEDGARYLNWLIDLIKSLGIDVPLITSDVSALRTIQGLPLSPGHAESAKPERLQRNLPVLWTKSGTPVPVPWNSEHFVESPFDTGYELLRFVAAGGAGFNYCPWHGGAALGRKAAYPQPAGQADAPLNEWGEPTSKSRLLGELHQALLAHEELLLQDKPHEVKPTENGVQVRRWGNAHNGCVITIHAGAAPRQIKIANGRKHLHPKTGASFWALKKGEAVLLWQSWPSGRRRSVTPVEGTPWKPAARSDSWLSLAEPRPSSRKDCIASLHPVEQLRLTDDSSDYCWYAAEVPSATARRALLKIQSGADFFYIFINSHLVNQTCGSLPEEWQPTTSRNTQRSVPASSPMENEAGPGREHSFSIPLNHGNNRLEILACSLGLASVDGPGPFSVRNERKGIWGSVSVDDMEIRHWLHYPGLVGEAMRLDSGMAREFPNLKWESLAHPAPLTWHLKEFTLSRQELSPHLAWAFDALGLTKGALWLNGHAVARVWPPMPPHRDNDMLPRMFTTDGKANPARRYYHIPRGWLHRHNRLVFLSETGAKPSQDTLVCRPCDTGETARAHSYKSR